MIMYRYNISLGLSFALASCMSDFEKSCKICLNVEHVSHKALTIKLLGKCDILAEICKIREPQEILQSSNPQPISDPMLIRPKNLFTSFSFISGIFLVGISAALIGGTFLLTCARGSDNKVHNSRRDNLQVQDPCYYSPKIPAQNYVTDFGSEFSIQTCV